MTTKTVSGARPSFFRALCHEAARGGTNAYQDAGYGLAKCVAGFLEEDFGEEEAGRRLEILADAIYTTTDEGLRGSPDDDAALAWFERELPRCMALVPPRRRHQFLKGVDRWAIEEGNDITAF